MKRILYCGLLFALVGPLFAGDIARFVNLGFSEDSRYLMFGQYGVEENGLNQYADIFTVDVASNRFVTSGVMNGRYAAKLEPGQDGIGALFTLYGDSFELARRFRINHMKSGRLLYLLVDGDEPKANLEFRDFAGGSSYKIALLQSRSGSGESVSSSFHINLTVTDAKGIVRHFTVGLPSYRRTGVIQYRIRQVIVSPDDKALVFVVEKDAAAATGVNVRYMVETVSLY